MIVHIAPIGIETDHVIQWLKEAIPVEKVWLIHSKVGKIDFEKKAKELEKKIKSFYEDCEVKRKIIHDPFSLDDTMDRIDEIVKEEEEKNPDILRQNFLINVTGGTNAMAAASIISAMVLGTKAHYVKDKRQIPTARKFVTELPIPPIGLAKMNQTQQKVLQVIANGTFELKHPDGKIISKQGPGIITNNDALEKMGWHKQINTGKRVRRLGATNMRSVAKKLEGLGYIKIIKGVPYFKEVHLGYGKSEWKEKTNESEVMYEITVLGKRQAKNTIMLDDSE